MTNYPINNLYNFIHIPNKSLMLLSKTNYINMSCQNLKTVATCLCKDCPIQKLYKDKEYCKHHHISKEDLDYECIFNCRKSKPSLFRRYKITGKDRDSMNTYYTKNTIRLFIHYICGSPTEEGLVGPYNLEQVSNVLGISSKTVKKQNQILEQAGIITVHNDTGKSYLVTLNHYKNSHLKHIKGGNGGYLQISREQIKDLMETEDINALRLKIQFYLWTMNRSSIKFPKSLDAIRNMLPSYINCKKKVKNILDKVASSVFFNCEVDSVSDTLSYGIPCEYSYTTLQNKYREDYENRYEDYLSQNSRYIRLSDGSYLRTYTDIAKERNKINTLIQLMDRNEYSQYINACVRYGFDYMDKALYRMGEFIQDIPDKLGAFLYDKAGKYIDNLSSYILYVASTI